MSERIEEIMMLNRLSKIRIPGWIVELSILAIIIILSATLRFYKLGEWSFWGDEAFTISTKEDGFNYSILRRSMATDLIRFSISYLGVSEWNARLTPALIGIITIPLIYFPTRRLFGIGTALLTVAFLAISPWHLYWSQNARFYTLLLLFYSLGLLTFQIALEEDRSWLFIGSLFLFGLAARERLIALIFLPVICLYLISIWLLPFDKPKGFRCKNLLLFLAPIFIVGILFIAPYAANLGAWFQGFGRVNTTPFWILAGTTYYVNLPILIIASFGCLYLLIRKNRTGLLLGINAFLPLATIMILSTFHYAANRYLFITLISWFILAAFAIVELYKNSEGATRVLALGLLTLALLAPLSEDVLYFQYQNGNRDNWKAALNYVEENRQNGDLVISANTDVSNFYLNEQTISMNNWDPGEISEGYRAWFIEDMNVAELQPELLSWLKDNTVEKANFDVHAQARNFKMRVYFYDTLSQPH